MLTTYFGHCDLGQMLCTQKAHISMIQIIHLVKPIMYE